MLKGQAKQISEDSQKLETDRLAHHKILEEGSKALEADELRAAEARCVSNVLQFRNCSLMEITPTTRESDQFNAPSLASSARHVMRTNVVQGHGFPNPYAESRAGDVDQAAICTFAHGVFCFILYFFNISNCSCTRRWRGSSLLLTFPAHFPFPRSNLCVG